MRVKDVKKVVLAYSGGLDTSIILKWLQATYGCEVVTFTADLGQGEELAPAREKALLLGIKPQNIFVEDLREEFVRDYVFPMFRANALYEGQYLLGTSIARPLIAKKQIEIAEKVGADAVAHAHRRQDAFFSSLTNPAEPGARHPLAQRMAKPPWSTASCSNPARSAKTSGWRSARWIPTTSSASAASRFSPRPPASAITT